MIKYIFIICGILFLLGIIKVFLSGTVQDLDKKEDYLDDIENEK
jgi:hypothetical protein